MSVTKKPNVMDIAALIKIDRGSKHERSEERGNRHPSENRVPEASRATPHHIKWPPTRED